MQHTKKTLDKREHKQRDTDEKKEVKAEMDEGQATELFTKRLQKSRLKDLERDLKQAQINNSASDVQKIKGRIEETRKAVFTDERKLEQRKKGFSRAQTNIKKAAMDEFM